MEMENFLDSRGLSLITGQNLHLIGKCGCGSNKYSSSTVWVEDLSELTKAKVFLKATPSLVAMSKTRADRGVEL